MAAPLTSICPFCHQVVDLLPPRRLANHATVMLPWRRRAHAVNGLGLSSAGARRCRYPVALPPSEYPIPGDIP
jgi:hypothetical protein